MNFRSKPCFYKYVKHHEDGTASYRNSTCIFLDRLHRFLNGKPLKWTKEGMNKRIFHFSNMIGSDVDYLEIGNTKYFIIEEPIKISKKEIIDDFGVDMYELPNYFCPTNYIKSFIDMGKDTVQIFRREKVRQEAFALMSGLDIERESNCDLEGELDSLEIKIYFYRNHYLHTNRYVQKYLDYNRHLKKSIVEEFVSLIINLKEIEDSISHCGLTPNEIQDHEERVKMYPIRMQQLQGLNPIF